MIPSSFYRFFSAMFLSLWSAFSFAIDDATRVAFYYGDEMPDSSWRVFNVVVVHPGKKIDPLKFNKPSSELYAYLSVGEVNPNEVYFGRTEKSFRLAPRSGFGEHVMDLSNPKFQNFIVKDIASELWQSGYRGFFIDTPDAWRHLSLSADEGKAQVEGLIALIKALRQSYPDAGIILNGGYEALGALHREINAVAAESLYITWNDEKNIYDEVSESRRRALTHILQEAHEHYHLPVVIVDYAPSGTAKEARKIAKKIRELGFIPWISNAWLDTHGVGLLEVIPRKILLLYYEHSESDSEDDVLPLVDATAFILQYMGYVPVLQSLQEPFIEKLKGQYAGVVLWLDGSEKNNTTMPLKNWLIKQVDAGVPIVLMGSLRLPEQMPLLNALHLGTMSNIEPSLPLVIAHQDKMIGFEMLPKPNALQFFPLSSHGEVLLSVEDSHHVRQDVIAVTDWGGYALGSYALSKLPDAHYRWVLQPFQFFEKALRLPTIPAPDLTTANGRRMLLSELQGDAFSSEIPWKEQMTAGKMILEEILKPFALPITVSLVAGELQALPDGARKEMILKEAETLFTLPWVRMATHTYSHPLDWTLNPENETKPEASVSYEDEIQKSAEWMNETFAATEKKAELILWSGKANVEEKALTVARLSHLENMNGLMKFYDVLHHSLSDLGSYGRNVGREFQVFSPLPDDYQYTHGFKKEAYAYENLIQVLLKTETPHRYKPAFLSYHFYAATTQASLRALKRIYKWASREPFYPLHLIDYVKKVQEFNDLVIARSLDDEWFVMGHAHLQEMRLPFRKVFPNMVKSEGVIGFNRVNDDVYIHLSKDSISKIILSKELPKMPYLVEANAQVSLWERNENKLHFKLEGYVPLIFKLANIAKNCRVTDSEGHVLLANKKGEYAFREALKGEFEVVC